MAGFDYKSLQGTAAGLFAQFNQGKIEYGVQAAGAGPAISPGLGATTWTTINATASGVSQKFIDQGLAIASDLQIQTGVTDGVTPKIGDLIRIDNGKVYAILQVLSKPAAGTPIAYTFIIRIGA